MTESMQEIIGKEITEKTPIEKPKTTKELEICTRQQKMMDLLLQGFSQEQIAEKLDVSTKTIQRDIAELRKGAVEWMENLPRGEYQIRFRKIFQQHDKIINELWDLYDNTDDEKLKLKILETIGKMEGTKMLDSTHLFAARDKAFHAIKLPSEFELSFGNDRSIDYDKIK